MTTVSHDPKPLGALVSPIGECQVLTDSEFTMLNHCIRLLRKGGWFADWMMLMVRGILTDGEPYPPPTQIMGALTESLGEYEEKLAAAAEFARYMPGAHQEAVDAAKK